MAFLVFRIPDVQRFLGWVLGILFFLNSLFKSSKPAQKKTTVGYVLEALEPGLGQGLLELLGDSGLRPDSSLRSLICYLHK